MEEKKKLESMKPWNKGNPGLELVHNKSLEQNTETAWYEKKN